MPEWKRWHQGWMSPWGTTIAILRLLCNLQEYIYTCVIGNIGWDCVQGRSPLCTRLDQTIALCFCTEFCGVHIKNYRHLRPPTHCPPILLFAWEQSREGGYEPADGFPTRGRRLSFWQRTDLWIHNAYVNPLMVPLDKTNSLLFNCTSIYTHVPGHHSSFYLYRHTQTKHCILGCIELGGKIKKNHFTYWLTLFSLYFLILRTIYFLAFFD